jgi:hypothetical protein
LLDLGERDEELDTAAVDVVLLVVFFLFLGPAFEHGLGPGGHGGFGRSRAAMSAFTRRLRAALSALAAFFRCGRASTCSGACGWPLAAVIARMAKTSEFS